MSRSSCHSARRLRDQGGFHHVRVLLQERKETLGDGGVVVGEGIRVLGIQMVLAEIVVGNRRQALVAVDGAQVRNGCNVILVNLDLRVIVPLANCASMVIC